MARFLAYINEFPWTWNSAMLEEFFSDVPDLAPQAVNDRRLSGRVTATLFPVSGPSTDGSISMISRWWCTVRSGRD